MTIPAERGPMHDGITGERRFHSIRGCYCPFCLEYRSRQNANKWYRESLRGNKPGITAPDEYAQARAKIGRMLSRMSQAQASALCGLSDSVVSRLLHNQRSALRRVTYDKIMAADEHARPPYLFDRAAGKLLDSTAARRKMQALQARGFSLNLLGRACGRADYLRAFLAGNGRITAELAEIIDLLYDKYQTADPVECGMTPQAASRLTTLSLGKGFALPVCWDDDTIGDPDAIPQWTGYCGTLRGYRLHKERGIPMCKACASKGQAYGSART